MLLSVQKSLGLAVVAATALVSAQVQAASNQFVFGKEPIARHNRAVAARRAQVSGGYRMTMQSPARTYTNGGASYGGTAMVQTYPTQRSYVTPVAGYRPQMAANSGAIVR
ncbi:MAG TPA: hypothetical protein VM510_00415 [Caulifigura sp.]|nr:hypothetical protein [Caulifigura sp.]